MLARKIKKTFTGWAVLIGTVVCLTHFDAATIVVCTPTILAGPHPYAAKAAFLANALKPNTKFLSVIGSYGWGGKTVETLAGMLPNLKAEIIDPVLYKGKPGKEAFQALDTMAETIAAKHKEIGCR